MMSNPFYGMAQGGMPNLMQMLQKVKANPMEILGGRFNLPAGMNDPQAMLQHLVQSGQISQEQLNRAVSMAQQMGIKR